MYIIHKESLAILSINSGYWGDDSCLDTEAKDRYMVSNKMALEEV
jgi:hypothetical protein